MRLVELKTGVPYLLLVEAKTTDEVLLVADRLASVLAELRAGGSRVTALVSAGEVHVVAGVEATDVDESFRTRAAVLGALVEGPCLTWSAREGDAVCALVAAGIVNMGYGRHGTECTWSLTDEVRAEVVANGPEVVALRSFKRPPTRIEPPPPEPEHFYDRVRRVIGQPFAGAVRAGCQGKTGPIDFLQVGGRSISEADWAKLQADGVAMVPYAERVGKHLG